MAMICSPLQYFSTIDHHWSLMAYSHHGSLLRFLEDTLEGLMIQLYSFHKVGCPISQMPKIQQHIPFWSLYTAVQLLLQCWSNMPQADHSARALHQCQHQTNLPEGLRAIEDCNNTKQRPEQCVSQTQQELCHVSQSTGRGPLCGRILLKA